MFLDEGVFDPQFFKLSDQDLDMRLNYHKSEIVGLQNSIKSNQRFVNLLEHEIRLRKAIKGEPPEKFDRCSYCGLSIEFDHPHNETNSVWQQQSLCDKKPVSLRVFEILERFPKVNTGNLLTKLQIELGDSWTKKEMLTILQNLKDNKFIVYISESWHMTETGLEKYRTVKQIEILKTGDSDAQDLRSSVSKSN